MAPSSKVQHNSTTACIWYLFFRKSTCEKHVQIMVQITQESHGAVMICPQKRVHHFRPHYALHHRCLNSGWCAKYVPLLDSSVVLLMKGADKKRNKNHFCAMGDHRGYLFWFEGYLVAACLHGSVAQRQPESGELWAVCWGALQLILPI